jgi:hypothetical protein
LQKFAGFDRNKLESFLKGGRVMKNDNSIFREISLGKYIDMAVAFQLEFKKHLQFMLSLPVNQLPEKCKIG